MKCRITVVRKKDLNQEIRVVANMHEQAERSLTGQTSNIWPKLLLGFFHDTLNLASLNAILEVRVHVKL